MTNFMPIHSKIWTKVHW